MIQYNSACVKVSKPQLDQKLKYCNPKNIIKYDL